MQTEPPTSWDPNHIEHSFTSNGHMTVIFITHDCDEHHTHIFLLSSASFVINTMSKCHEFCLLFFLSSPPANHGFREYFP
jgi:hypothetical protein